MNCSACGGWAYVRTQPIQGGFAGRAVFAALPVSAVPKDDLIPQYPREAMPRTSGARLCRRCEGTGIEPVSHEMSVTSANLAQIQNRPASRGEMSKGMTR